MENVQAVTTMVNFHFNFGNSYFKIDWSSSAVSLAPRSDICNILPHFCQDSNPCCIAGAARNRGIYSTGARAEVTEDTGDHFRKNGKKLIYSNLLQPPKLGSVAALRSETPEQRQILSVIFIPKKENQNKKGLKIEISK